MVMVMDMVMIMVMAKIKVTVMVVVMVIVMVIIMVRLWVYSIFVIITSPFFLQKTAMDSCSKWHRQFRKRKNNGFQSLSFSDSNP